MVVTEQTRNAVWQQMLDVARVARYYGEFPPLYCYEHPNSKRSGVRESEVTPAIFSN